jgi:hypothetical protein
MRDCLKLPLAPHVRSYDACYSADQCRYHLLLEDVSDTHVGAAERPPDLEYGKALVDRLAAMHAHWLGEERLAAISEALPRREQMIPFLKVARRGAPRYIESCATELAPRWPAAIVGLCARRRDATAERVKNPSDSPSPMVTSRNNILVARAGSEPTL